MDGAGHRRAVSDSGNEMQASPPIPTGSSAAASQISQDGPRDQDRVSPKLTSEMAPSHPALALSHKGSGPGFKAGLSHARTRGRSFRRTIGRWEPFPSGVGRKAGASVLGEVTVVYRAHSQLHTTWSVRPVAGPSFAAVAAVTRAVSQPPTIRGSGINVAPLFWKEHYGY